jgi:hypothetical protein
MTRTILIDEIHVTLLAPANLMKGDFAAIQKTLRGKRFLMRFNEAVRQVLRRYSSLSQLKTKIDR